MIVRRFLYWSVLLFFLYGCAKESELNDEIYKFESTVEILTESDLINTNDTIWIESTIQGFIKDSVSNKNIHFQKANIYLNMLMRYWNSSDISKNFDNLDFVFDTHVDFKTGINNATLLGFYYTEDKGMYKIKCGVIFNKPGVYSIDTDFLILENYFSDDAYYLGGGMVELEDINGSYKSGAFSCDIDVENRNLHHYIELSDADKNLYNVVNEENENKYFFIKVIE